MPNLDKNATSDLYIIYKYLIKNLRKKFAQKNIHVYLFINKCVYFDCEQQHGISIRKYPTRNNIALIYNHNKFWAWEKSERWVEIADINDSECFTYIVNYLFNMHMHKLSK